MRYMQYRKLGKTGLKVSALGFGSMRLPMNNGQVDVESALNVLNKAFDMGVNLVDTAVGYCNQQSEITVGKALRGGEKGSRCQRRIHTRELRGRNGGLCWTNPLKGLKLSG